MNDDQQEKQIVPQGSAVEGTLDLNAPSFVWQTAAEIERCMAGLSYDELRAQVSADPWLFNYLLSQWEKVHRCTTLTAYPWNLTLGITSTCNAKCRFCSVWLRRSRLPALDVDTVPHLERLLSHVRILLLTGGEPTIHPRFREMLGHIENLVDPRAYITMITHGNRLRLFEDELSRARVNYVVSLNAATAKTHHSLMNLGADAFPKIVDSIRWARSIGRQVDLSLVVVKENLEEIPDFLRLAEELDVHGVYLRSLIPGDYYAVLFPNSDDFIGLPAWSHPDLALLQDRARKAIEETNIEVYGDPGQWSARLQSAKLPPNTDWNVLFAATRDDPLLVTSKGEPLLEGASRDQWRVPVSNPYGRTAPFACDYPWYALKILDPSQRIYPCGFMHQVMGYDDVGLSGSEDFFELWNSPAMVHLRDSLERGPLVPECITCPSQMGGCGQCQSDHDS